MFMKHSTHFEPAEKITLARLGVGHVTEPVSAGLLVGSLVETTSGWRPVETLKQGMRVATYDGGFRPVVRLGRRRLSPDGPRKIIHVPAGTIDNCSALNLLPDQHVFLASQAAEEVLDTAGALLPAGALVGYRGIVARPVAAPVEVLTVRFDEEEVVYVNSGALLHCPTARPDAGDGRVRSEFFEVLDEPRARAMLALIADATTAGERLRMAA
ncbi:hypothetical protein DEA8626_02277 [Defluviimonas aquaemixtae]|uniref:Hedgehog/Intein (Hint) domain-containing protein n=1 Tax=Albidovulum aquaemixtae TaxID=1542388 RepID=A0A2R8B7V4_9RHOB|nr:Hint domain-containing protein [Defluviimonas aquaemixtae]SPH18735.1 hypothetical protein DEA8626_02277 [Defluviimonas aquaemixtae]